MAAGRPIACVFWLALLGACQGPPQAGSPGAPPEHGPAGGSLSLEMALLESTDQARPSPGLLQVTLRNRSGDTVTLEEPRPVVPEAARETQTRLALLVLDSLGMPTPASSMLTGHFEEDVEKPRWVSLAPGESWSRSYDLNELYPWGPCGPAMPIWEVLSPGTAPLEIQAVIAFSDGVVESPRAAAPGWLFRHASRLDASDPSGGAHEREMQRRRAAVFRGTEKATSAKPEKEIGDSPTRLLDAYCGRPGHSHDVDPDSEARRQAKLAVLELGEKGVPFLFEALRFEDDDLNDCAAELLGALHEAGKLADPWLLDGLRSGAGPLRSGVLEALDGGGPPWNGTRKSSRLSPEVTSAIVKILEEGDSWDRHQAVRALGRAGLVEAVEPLTRALTTGDRQVQVAAMGSLARIGPEAGSAIPVIESIALSGGHNARFARSALRELARGQLPDGGIRERTEGDMEMPPRDADAIIFIVDRSGSSMPGFRFSQRHMVKVIRALEEEDEFGIIFSDNGVAAHPSGRKLARAQAEERRSATEFVLAMEGGSASCPYKAFAAALDLAEASEAKRKLIYYIGDGGGTCMGGDERKYLEKMLEEVARRNAGAAEIHAIAVGAGPFGEDVLQELASRNRGTFTRILQE